MNKKLSDEEDPYEDLTQLLLLRHSASVCWLGLFLLALRSNQRGQRHGPASKQQEKAKTFVPRDEIRMH